MRMAHAYAEEDLTSGSPAEFNLGIGSVLGIFFGLALICGVFFGFGYTLGHRSPFAHVVSAPPAESPETASAPIASKPSAEVLQPEATPAPQAAPPPRTASTSQTVVVLATPPASPALVTPSPVQEAAATSSAPRPRSLAVKAANISVSSASPSQTISNAPSPLPAASAPLPQTTGTLMVQIAAVKSRPDAEALASALRRNGFSPSVRTESQDKLFHVQVGPFVSRDEAKAMRVKLSNAGYDAFIK